MLKHYELKSIRELLFYSQSEAAVLIGGVSHRSWSRWESGEAPIRKDVELTIGDLLEFREQLLDDLHEAKNQHQDNPHFDGIILIFYLTIADFMYNNDAAELGRNQVEWRPYHSALTQFYSDTMHMTKTVAFDVQKYESFLQETQKTDCNQSRMEWAAHEVSKDGV